ncbi:hypothetical protein OH491_02120 [Termitidicoccus mucosus]|uniref:Virulence protein SciE type n=1 Tax=Termitidicoccus mucosus TaxID=1184151 RepID=A0A178INH4_9BACT|nr:hypothetical protein AW736_07435 [Opitutaceae bacterium TSB47]
MPSPSDLLKHADIDGALAAANQAVRAAPADPKQRLFLYQLNCVLGRWDKALSQLAIFAELSTDPESKLTARIYRTAIQCEVFRAEVFAGKRQPLLLGEPEEWVACLMQACQLLAQGRATAAAELRDRAFEAAPATPGAVDGRPFAWLADADNRLGPVVELFMEGKYYWVPVNRIRRIALEPPQNLSDLVFAPAQFMWTNGGEGAGFIPVRYAAPAGADAKPDPKCLLSRLTQWRELPDGFTVGSGQRMLATDAEEIPLLDCRVIDFQGGE